MENNMDKKIPDVTVVRIPTFRAVTKGLVSWDEIFDESYESWRSAHSHFFTPILYDSPDFMFQQDGKVAWIWKIKDNISGTDVKPYEITEFQGGLYALAVSIDADGESHDKVRHKMEKWLESTNFVIDHDREMLGHMIYVDDEIKLGLGYEQMVLYAPIKLKEGITK